MVIQQTGAQSELIVQWTDPVNGLACKAKLDISYQDHRGKHVIDLKSTGEGSKAAFLRSCEKYEYERQAAFYLDGAGAKTMTIYGIQKRPPYKVFRKMYTKKELEEGRRKYRFILSKAQELQNREFDLSPGLEKKRA